MPRTEPAPMQRIDDETEDAERARADLVARHREDGNEEDSRIPTAAGRAYAGDHKNHGEEDLDEDDVIEELDLDELPSFEGPDA